MINESHVEFFEGHEKVCVEDMFGFGEALFARKLSDNRLDLVERIDEMISQKEARNTLSLQSGN